jgi:hypothetical protein
MEVLFIDQNPDSLVQIPMSMHYADGTWTDPEVLAFRGVPDGVVSFQFSPDMERLVLFVESTPGKSVPPDNEGFWLVERAGSRWLPARHLGPPGALEHNDGPLYLGAIRSEGQGASDIYRTGWSGDAYGSIEHLAPPVNSAAEEYPACVAPDESFLVFYRFDDSDKASSGLYAAFRQADASWADPVSIDEPFGLSLGFAASLSPDSRYLFLLDRGRGVFWVDVSALDQLRPQD